MKTAEQIKPNYSPVYAAALYPQLARIFIDNGYALAVHGSMARDFDLIAVPWTEKVSEPDILISIITTKFAITLIEDEHGKFDKKNHGRIAYTLSIGHGECAIDLSFMPIAMDEILKNAFEIARMKAANMQPVGLDIPLMTHDITEEGCNGLKDCPIHNPL